MEEKIRDLQDQLLDINERVQTIQARADAENRALTEDEEKEINSNFARFEAVEGEIDRRKAIIAQNMKLNLSQGLKVELQDPDPQNRMPDNDEPPLPRKQARRGSGIQVFEDRGKWGWKGLGDFAVAVRVACKQGGQIDPRLVMNAPTTYSSEGIGAEGGFLVPPEFRTEIWKKVAGEDSLLARTDMNTTSRNTIVFPADETTPWDSSGGIQAYWESEAGLKDQSRIALKEKTIRLNKLTALVPVTEELLEDAAGLDGYLRKKVADKFDFKINLKIVQGTGAGEPLGILNSPSLVTVAKETQAADTILALNILKMYSAMYAPCRRNAVWLINQDCEPQLNQMVLEGTAGGIFPVYLPPGGLSVAPYGTLMGRPVIPTQACETVGDVGDIIFVDLSQYLTCVKGGGIRTDVSMHLWFDYDVVAYRFVMRLAGQPWWASEVLPRDGTNYLSWAVALAERAGT